MPKTQNYRPISNWKTEEGKWQNNYDMYRSSDVLLVIFELLIDSLYKARQFKFGWGSHQVPFEFSQDPIFIFPMQKEIIPLWHQREKITAYDRLFINRPQEISNLRLITNSNCQTGFIYPSKWKCKTKPMLPQ